MSHHPFYIKILNEAGFATRTDYEDAINRAMELGWRIIGTAVDEDCYLRVILRYVQNEIDGLPSDEALEEIGNL